MPSPLSGPGIGLPFPQNLYPSELTNAPQDASCNKQALAPGDTLVLPAGDWYVGLGLYLVLQYLDPVTGVWTYASGSAWDRGVQFVKSDGFNVRIANLTGCVVGAVVAAAGNGSYVQATTTITAIGTFGNGAAPTLLPIIGGQLGETGTFTIDVPTAGAGYGVAPIIMIPPPPPANVNANGVGGIPAQAIAILGSGGSISSVSIINPGAGYPSAPTAVVVPSPFDPNLSVGITQATVAFSVTGSGSLTGALVTNSGAPLNNGSLGSVTLSIGGAGASASLSAVVMQTVVTASISGPGVGYGTTQALIDTVGGVPATSTYANNPDSLYLAWTPRPAQIGLTPANTSVSVATAGAIYDGGLFLGTPQPILTPGNGIATPTTIATVALVMGSKPDIAIIQQAP